MADLENSPQAGGEAPGDGHPGAPSAPGDAGDGAPAEAWLGDASGGDPDRPPPAPVPAAAPSFFENLPQFVIFPLIVVLVAVLIIVFVRSAVETDRPIAEILGEIQSGWRKTQPAHELAVRARLLEEEGRRFSEADTRLLIDILGKTEDAALRGFLLAALGRAGAEGLSTRQIVEALSRPGATEIERIHAARALGLSRSPESVTPLLAELERWRSNDEWEGRLNILTSLANLALALRIASPQDAERAVAALRSRVHDPVWTVSWNMAILLAASFHDTSGLDTLRKLIDREHLALHVPVSQEQDPWIERAVGALGEIRDLESRTAIEALRDDRSMKVRNAAFHFLHRIEQPVPPPEAGEPPGRSSRRGDAARVSRPRGRAA